jgi:hypothetical protein
MQYEKLSTGEYRLTDVPYGKERITVTIAPLTPLELLDAPLTADMDRVKMACFNACHAIADWNGEGLPNPLLLVSDRKAHRAVGNINVFIQEHLFERALPSAIGEEQEDGAFVFVFADGSEAITKPVSMLEMLEIRGKVTGNGSRDRCEIYAQILTEWFGQAATVDQLLLDKEHHGHLVEIDQFFTDFFRPEQATEIEAGTLPDGDRDEQRERDSSSSRLVNIARA